MPIAKEPYGQLPDGTEIDLYTLTNAAGLRVTVITYGAILAEVVVPDRDGKMVNVNLGRDSLADYVADNSPYLGATVGRCAGRIARGTFTLDGKEYSLALNDGGKHHIHGGWKGFDKVAWKARPSDGAAGVALAYVSADGEEGYPGRLSVQLTYSLSDANELKLEYDAACDKPTIVNLTNHAYWNLAGAGCGDVLGHELTIHADRFLEGDEDLLPAGSPQPVRNTPCDFTQPAAIGARIAQLGLGYDNCYVLKKPGGEGSLSLAARALEPQSGRTMEVFTTEPAVQFYTGNFLDGAIVSAGKAYRRHFGFCLEAQHFPDALRHPDYPSTVLRPGETYRQTTLHKFGVRK